MTSGVANVRTYFYRGSLIDPPTGWLLNKKSGLLIFFESYKKSLSNNLKVYTHLFYANELGEPAQIKNSRLHSMNLLEINFLGNHLESNHYYPRLNFV